MKYKKYCIQIANANKTGSIQTSNLHKVKTEMLTCKRRENDSFYLKKKK